MKEDNADAEEMKFYRMEKGADRAFLAFLRDLDNLRRVAKDHGIEGDDFYKVMALLELSTTNENLDYLIDDFDELMQKSINTNWNGLSNICQVIMDK